MARTQMETNAASKSLINFPVWFEFNVAETQEPYCFSMAYVKLQGHTALKIVDFDPNWAFPDCISRF